MIGNKHPPSRRIDPIDHLKWAPRVHIFSKTRPQLLANKPSMRAPRHDLGLGEGDSFVINLSNRSWLLVLTDEGGRQPMVFSAFSYHTKTLRIDFQSQTLMVDFLTMYWLSVCWQYGALSVLILISPCIQNVSAQNVSCNKTSPEQNVSITKRLHGKNISILHFEEGKICMCVHKKRKSASFTVYT
jgi:hypothetical protein